MRTALLAAIAILMLALALSACAASRPGPDDRLLLGGSSAQPSPAPSSNMVKAKPGEVDYSCKVDADCAVKDVGNCCGYYPQCVNADSPTFPDQVKAECAREGRSSICGFPSIESCQCVQGRCAAKTGMQGGEQEITQ
ncbi:hypothetical protein [Pseudomarimonas arenosa]|uniref:Secreted protein n=1 Tax=Pseudomarimonas arenosa TaxID=2774145 RepID=A0AAW3ZQJ2_9GAMM|nr:hypothetical protein [Pseudomarimonas arenosa]MBD8528223.1 hypothetical protein [Pseudomarimonas arenosa]